MNTKERILTICLSKKIEKNVEYAKSIGLTSLIRMSEDGKRNQKLRIMQR